MGIGFNPFARVIVSLDACSRGKVASDSLRQNFFCPTYIEWGEHYIGIHVNFVNYSVGHDFDGEKVP